MGAAQVRLSNFTCCCAHACGMHVSELHYGICSKVAVTHLTAPCHSTSQRKCARHAQTTTILAHTGGATNVTAGETECIASLLAVPLVRIAFGRLRTASSRCHDRERASVNSFGRRSLCNACRSYAPSSARSIRAAKAWPRRLFASAHRGHLLRYAHCNRGFAREYDETPDCQMTHRIEK
jgi:hypothetical protein